MPSAPQILPTQVTQGTAPGLSYRLEGELVPALHMALDGQVPIYFEHHVLLWKYPTLQIGLHPLKKGLKRRVFGGMPLLLLEAQSAGELAFSRDAPGHIAAIHLQPGRGDRRARAPVPGRHRRGRVRLQPDQGLREHDVRRRASSSTTSWPPTARASSGSTATATCSRRSLDAGESIDIEPGGWVYRDHSVQMSQEVYGFKTGFLSGGAGNLVFNRFTGPGRVCLQSAYFHPPVAEGAGGAAQRGDGGGLLGGIVGGLLDN